MAESYTGEAYCVKCKEKRDFTGEVVVSARHVAGQQHNAQQCQRPE